MRKTVCITGASRGIGKAAALKFAAEGYDLALSCVKNESALRETAAEAERLGSRTMLFVGDIGDPEACSRFFELIRGTFGRLDVLVCNAGISRHGLFQDMQPAEWDEMIRTNLSSVFYLSRLAVPMMLHRGGGKIITVSSVWGAAGASCETAYSAAKGGVIQLTRTTAIEYAGLNIRCNSVSLGITLTEMVADVDGDTLTAIVPAHKAGTPEGLANCILYLATDESPFLTGQDIAVDGGVTCGRCPEPPEDFLKELRS